MASGERVAYLEAGAAMRQALERAVVMAEYLKPRDWRVLLAVINLTASYSKISDETSVGQVSELSGVSESRAAESLRRLDAAGVIVWKPTRTRGALGPSTVSLVGASPDWKRLHRGTPTATSIDDEAIPF